MMSRNSILKRTWPIVIQSAQAHRKPRWVPVAKSKIYRIPKRPVLPQEERLELTRVHNNYKTQMRAIRRFYHEDMIKEMSSLDSGSSEMSQQVEAEDWQRCMELNDKWNAQVAAEREARLKTELAAMEEHALSRMQAKDLELKLRVEKASAAIRREKELSSTFITPETLEEAIDRALANPVDYNFAIDLHGNQHFGRDTPITTAKEQKATTP